MKSRFVRLFLSLVVLAVLGTPLAHAQATRTWVSGVGDDANPCSRTAPCKTFAGAISKTAPNGEINVLDPGGFGAVTITKPITISSENFEAGVLVSGTNGIIVTVPNAGDVVVLRGLDIQGLGTGLSGIKVITGGNVQIDKCTIDRFSIGVDFEPTVAGSQLHVTDSIVRNNGAARRGEASSSPPPARRRPHSTTCGCRPTSSASRPRAAPIPRCPTAAPRATSSPASRPSARRP